MGPSPKSATHNTIPHIFIRMKRINIGTAEADTEADGDTNRARSLCTEMMTGNSCLCVKSFDTVSPTQDMIYNTLKNVGLVTVIKSRVWVCLWVCGVLPVE